MTWLGTLPGWFTLALLVGAAYAFRRGGGGTAISELQTANQVLEKTVHRQGEEILDLRKQLAASEARTDIALALGPLLSAIEAHETNAAKRAEVMIGVIEAIGVTLGQG